MSRKSIPRKAITETPYFYNDTFYSDNFLYHFGNFFFTLKIEKWFPVFLKRFFPFIAGNNEQCIIILIFHIDKIVMVSPFIRVHRNTKLMKQTSQFFDIHCCVKIFHGFPFFVKVFFHLFALNFFVLFPPEAFLLPFRLHQQEYSKCMQVPVYLRTFLSYLVHS